MKLADLFIKLGLRKEGFDKGLNDAKDKTNAFGSAMKKIGGVIAGAFAVGAIINFAKQAVKAYDIQAKAEAQLLQAVGNRAEIQQRLIRQAGELQKKTLFGDEETIRAQALLGALVKEANQIEKIIPLVQDFAAAKRIDLASAADLVGKTLGSTTNALGRYGIEVTGAVGSVERLTTLQKGLNDAFGGQAETAAKAGVGAIKQLSNAWGDLMESIGGGQSDNINQLARALTFLVQSVTEKMTEGRVKASAFSMALIEALQADIKDLPVEKKIETIQSKIDEYKSRLKIAEKNIPSYWSRILSFGKYKERKKALENIDEYKQKINDLEILLSSIKPPLLADDENQIGLLKALEQAAKDARAELEAFKKLPGKFAGEESAQAYIDKLDELEKKAKDADIALEAALPKTGMAKITPIGTSKDALLGLFPTIEPDTSQLDNMDSFSNKMNEKLLKIFGQETLDKLKAQGAAFQDAEDQLLSDMNASLEHGIESGLMTLGQQLGEAFATEDWSNFGNAILDVVGQFLVQMGSALIAYGVAMDAFKKAFENPWVAIAAGVALVAIGSYISSKASAGPGKHSSAYSGASGYSPSSSSATTALAGDVRFVLEGDKLVGAIGASNRKRAITG